MRILFTCTGGLGHFEPLRPLAQAATAAGHTVAVASGSWLREAVAKAGLTVFDLGSGEPDTADTITELVPFDAAKEQQALADAWVRRIAAARYPALLTLATDWKPDLIIRDETDYGAGLAAETLGLPGVPVTSLTAGGFATRAAIAEALHEVRATHGLPADPALTMLDNPVLSPLPLSYRDPADPLPPGSRAFRTLTPQPPGDTPDWVRPGRPAIYFTLGTIFNRECGDLFTRVLTGLREVDAGVLVTVGRQLDPALFGPQPDHIRIERFRPQAEVLPHCDLVISHAGSGSVTGALAHGLPGLLLPMGADQPYNADRCAALGLARVLDPSTATPEQVHANLIELLTNPAYTERTQAYAGEIAAQPDAAATLAWLTTAAAVGALAEDLS